TSFPRVLTATVVDSCGSAVSDANVIAVIEGVTIILQPQGSGLYSGTWVPARDGSITVAFTAIRAGLTTAKQSIVVSTGASASGVQLPVLAADGVVEGAGFTARRLLSPGAIVSLFGS